MAAGSTAPVAAPLARLRQLRIAGQIFAMKADAWDRRLE